MATSDDSNPKISIKWPTGEETELDSFVGTASNEPKYGQRISIPNGMEDRWVTIEQVVAQRLKARGSKINAGELMIGSIHGDVNNWGVSPEQMVQALKDSGANSMRMSCQNCGSVSFDIFVMRGNVYGLVCQHCTHRTYIPGSKPTPKLDKQLDDLRDIVSDAMSVESIEQGEPDQQYHRVEGVGSLVLVACAYCNDTKPSVKAWWDGEQYYVRCDGCGSRTGTCGDPYDAVINWTRVNSRGSMTKIISEVMENNVDEVLTPYIHPRWIGQVLKALSIMMAAGRKTVKINRVIHVLSAILNMSAWRKISEDSDYAVEIVDASDQIMAMTDNLAQFDFPQGTQIKRVSKPGDLGLLLSDMTTERLLRIADMQSRKRKRAKEQAKEK